MPTKTIKTFTKLFAAMVALVAVMPALAAAYYGGDITVSQDAAKVCPCRIISSGEMSAKVTNYGTKSDTFYLSVSVPDGWSSFIVPELTLASGETEEVSSFWISPPCGTLPGKYVARLRAESAASGKSDEEEMQFEVMKCHTAEIEAVGFSACSGEPASSSAFLVNTGNLKDTFRINASPSWVSVSPSSVTAAELSKAAFKVTATPPAGTSGKISVMISASAENTYATAAKNITIDVLRCTYFSASMVPPKENPCLGDTTEYYVSIDNKGTRDDKYVISAPSWVTVSEKTVSVPAGARKTVKLSASPVSAGQKKLTVYVSSANFPTEIVPVESVISVRDCRAASATLSPSALSVCRGEPASLALSVKNTGNMQTSYGVSFFVGSASSSEQVTLGKGDSQELSIELGTSSLGKYPVIAEVRIGNATVSSASSIISVDDCYNAGMQVPNATGSVCAGDRVEAEVFVKNTGTKTDDYTLVHPGGTEKFSLFPGKEVAIVSSFDADYPWESKNNLTFTLKSSGGASASNVISLSMEKEESCYSVALAAAPVMQILYGNGSSHAVKIKNAGKRADSYGLSIGGPEWAYLSQESLDLAAGEEKTVYVYAFPPYGTMEGNYTITVLAESASSISGVTISAEVAGSFVDGGVDASAGGITGMFLFSAMTLEAAMLSMMAVLTVLIVYLRFVVFK